MEEPGNRNDFEAISAMVDGFLRELPGKRPVPRCPPRKRPAKATNTDSQSIAFAVTELHGALRTRKQALLMMQAL